MEALLPESFLVSLLPPPRFNLPEILFSLLVYVDSAAPTFTLFLATIDMSLLLFTFVPWKLISFPDTTSRLPPEEIKPVMAFLVSDDVFSIPPPSPNPIVLPLGFVPIDPDALALVLSDDEELVLFACSNLTFLPAVICVEPFSDVIFTP